MINKIVDANIKYSLELCKVWLSYSSEVKSIFRDERKKQQGLA